MTRWQIQQLKKQMKKNRVIIERVKKKSDDYHEAEQKEVDNLEQQMDQIYAQTA
ncbi:hypothetical protein IJM86_08765 [bacterium]|nr:hypothetical protein [bacterium]